MTEETRYRLACAGDNDTMHTCTFDAASGDKDCPDELGVRFETQGDAPSISFELVDSKRHAIKLRELAWGLGSTYWYKVGEKDFHCKLTELNSNDEAQFAQMPQTHPKTWALIKDHLGKYYDTDVTFREQAIRFLKEGYLDETMWPSMLSEVSSLACAESEPAELQVTEKPPEDLWQIPNLPRSHRRS